MDTHQQFLRKVIIPYGVQEFLKPKQLEHGEVKYGLISILKENINSCYNSIDNEFKKELINYIQDFLTELNIRIRSKKEKVKSIKKLIKKSKNGDENDDLVYQLQIEEYIHSYLLDQHDFLKNWIVKKESIIGFNKTKKKEPKVYNWHALIIPLVNGSINRIHQKYGEQIEATELSTIIIEELKLETEVNKIRPYIQSTFTSEIKSRKNLFCKEKVKKMITLCKEKGVIITDDIFINKAKKYNLELN
jgi:hypothetical protein